MTALHLVPLPGNEAMAERLAALLGAKARAIETRRFPDGETYLRYRGAVRGASIALVCTLDHPDTKLLPLVFAATTAKDLGARSVGLVAPYLAYMRQDRRFKPGEALTSAAFARLLSAALDWLVTVDPHLHRRRSLAEIYGIPTRVACASPAIAQWITGNVERPLVIGPDSESKQWVAAIAESVHAPYATLQKTRHGDRSVTVALPALAQWNVHTPVLVDDIISTGETMIAAARALGRLKMPAPICIGIHGIFADAAHARLKKAGARRIVTTNTIAHKTNAIDVAPAIAEAIRALAFGEGPLRTRRR